MFSSSSVFNIGDFQSVGYMLSVAQALVDRISITAAAGSGSALTPERRELGGDRPDDVRGVMRHGRRQWVSAAFSGTAPRAGTQFATSYLWTDGRSLTPAHVYLTQTVRPDIGWNVYLRQPIPVFPGLPGHFEASADLRNLLAQGYIPLATAQGRKVYMMHTPRSVRGGVSFIF
jgi:hypothetical protein